MHSCTHIHFNIKREQIVLFYEQFGSVIKPIRRGHVLGEWSWLENLSRLRGHNFTPFLGGILDKKITKGSYKEISDHNFRKIWLFVSDKTFYCYLIFILTRIRLCKTVSLRNTIKREIIKTVLHRQVGRLAWSICLQNSCSDFAINKTLVMIFFAFFIFTSISCG